MGTRNVVFVVRGRAFSWNFGRGQSRGLEGDAGSLWTGWIDYVGRSTLDKDACFSPVFEWFLHRGVEPGFISF